MGLRDTLRTAASTAISAIGDLARSVDYKSRRTGTPLDPVNGPTEHFDVYPSISAAILDYKSNETDGDSIRETDQKMLFAQSGLTFTPKEGDLVEEGTDRWRVVSVMQDPAQATWTCQIRRMN